MPSPFVNFLVIGAQKCGTTAFARFLGQHPGICMAEDKELHVFDDEHWPGVQSVEQVDAVYRARIGNYTGQPLVGEATPVYLWLPYVVEDLHRYNPQLKLIVLLRDPVERSISHYRMERVRGKESLPLWRALLAERGRLHADRGNRSRWAPSRYHSYLDRSRYARQLEHLSRFFPREQVLLLKTEALRTHHAETLNAAFRFLGTDELGHEIGAGEPEPPPGPARGEPWVRPLLRLYFRPERRRLRGMLPFPIDDWS
jgi:hypothetical protein